ncbi:MAG: glycosyltransferase family 2 protein [Gammaproteobacteria bacterium]
MEFAEQTSATTYLANDIKVSFIIEWANTEYNGIPRFFKLLDIISRQWQQLLDKEYPANLKPEALAYLSGINPLPEVLIISGQLLSPEQTQKISNCTVCSSKPTILNSEGLEYYALKNYGAEHASGDILCFLDSDIYPDENWLEYVFGSFAQPDISVVCGQPYVEHQDLFSRAFALGWTYKLPERKEELTRAEKWYANNVAFRAEIFHKTPFPPLTRRTRGAGSLITRELKKHGHKVMINGMAHVSHPAPSSWKHMLIRALAHGRDQYMKNTEERTLHGFFYCQKIAIGRFVRAVVNISKNWHKVGLQRFETVPAIIIMGCYYLFFSLGGIMTHISPEFMGRHFRL